VRLFPQKKDHYYLILAKWMTFIIGTIGIGIALYMAESEIYSLWDQFNTILGLFTGGLGGLFILALFIKKATSTGVLIGLFGSGLVQLYIKEYTDINFLLYAFTGLISCVIFGYIFSLMFSTKKIIGHE
jgi:hypothetical protein